MKLPVATLSLSSWTLRPSIGTLQGADGLYEAGHSQGIGMLRSNLSQAFGQPHRMQGVAHGMEVFTATYLNMIISYSTQPRDHRSLL